MRTGRKLLPGQYVWMLRCLCRINRLQRKDNRKEQRAVRPLSQRYHAVWVMRGELLGAPSRIRTCDLRLRRPLLYPTELLARRRWDEARTTIPCWTAKINPHFGQPCCRYARSPPVPDTAAWFPARQFKRRRGCSTLPAFWGCWIDFSSVDCMNIFFPFLCP